MNDLLDPLNTLVRQTPWLTLAWISLMGGCVGSFLNVVVYRLPAGMSLLRPGSRCPACHHPIRWYDNIPVLGWLRLRGRCRDCQAAIAPRYPLVEAVVMGLFAQQWLQDVGRVPAGDALGPALFAFVWHVGLLSVLVCAALIDFDGHRIPVSVLAFGTALALLMACVWPTAVGRLLQREDVGSVWAEMIAGSVLAALVTCLLRPALLMHRTATRDSRPTRDLSSVALSAMSGLYLGPERAVVTLLLTSLLWRLLRRMRPGSAGGAPWSWYLAALCWVAVAFT
jgi:leader peptidase (prepilin peptidase)/N-methyltransferase